MDYCVVSIAGHCGAEGMGTAMADCFPTKKEAEAFQEELLEIGRENPCSKCGALDEGRLGQIFLIPESELNEFMGD